MSSLGSGTLDETEHFESYLKTLKKKIEETQVLVLRFQNGNASADVLVMYQ